MQKQLQEDAAQDIPPFAADSIKLARQLGPAAVNILLEQINAQRETRFLALEALREASPDVYHSLPARKCAEIYGEALRTAVFYNAWGIPGHQLTETAKAFIDLGEEAIAALKPQLNDKHEAPLSGSHEATASEIYGNRICDYAWILINEIRQQPYVYSLNPVERDQAIDALQQSL